MSLIKHYPPTFKRRFDIGKVVYYFFASNEDAGERVGRIVEIGDGKVLGEKGEEPTAEALAAAATTPDKVQAVSGAVWEFGWRLVRPSPSSVMGPVTAPRDPTRQERTAVATTNTPPA